MGAKRTPGQDDQNAEYLAVGALRGGRNLKESTLENRFRKAVKDRGGIAWKFVSPGESGVPDRIVLLPNGRHVFVELKKPGEKPTPLQLWQHDRLRRWGHAVHVIDSTAGIEAFVKEVMPV